MTYIKLAAVVAFSLMVLIPLAGFRFGEGIVSEIDNRKLQENPFRAEEQAKKSFKNLVADYVSDRIGFRDEMILAYTLLNDKLFGEMVHPRYQYGKEGFVFTREMKTPVYGKYHETFADMVKQVQDYCEARGVPFLFVLEPIKQRILDKYLPEGVHYDAHWVDEFIRALDERGVHYVDNTVTMRQKMAEGTAVFNRQFDAAHWNELGLFYGTNAILEELHKRIPEICPLDIDSFETSEVLKESLPVSKFPIHEYVPEVKVPLKKIKNISKGYDTELERHEQHRGFGYYRNRARLADTPRGLFFQGSYLNKGPKFLKYALGDYIFVHDYQNILEFPYYFNIFKPEYVVFEVAEYTVNDKHFALKKMENLRFNPPLSSVMTNPQGEASQQHLPSEGISVQEGKALTKIHWKDAPKGIENAWCLLGEEFDMRPSPKGGYEVTVKNEVWQKYGKEMKIVTLEDGELRIYM